MRKLFTTLAIAVLASSVFSSTSFASNLDSEVTSSASYSETEECVLAHSTDTYRVTFTGGEEAMVMVIGDGDTDLDLYIYDENGNLIESDTDRSDTMICTWTPKWTGKFTIKIKNLGSVRNYYTMWIY